MEVPAAASWLAAASRSLLALCCMLSLVSARDVKPQQELYLPDYRFYHNLSTIQSDLEDIVSKNSNFMKIDWMYRSRQNRPQMLIRVTNYTSDGWTYTASESMPRQHNKLKVLLSFGEHAREFLPIESMFYLLKNLTQGLTYPKDSPEENFSRTILSKVDMYIVGVMNPDGRQYVESTRNYCWRGTSTGVDLNRNFDWRFGDKGSSSKKDDEEYRGEGPFSEPECLVLVELTSKLKFDAFISFHSGIRQIYVPYADTVSKHTREKPDNLEAMLELADIMSRATPARFTYGLAYQLNQYTADGTIFDYMAGIRKIPFSLAVELWGEGDHKGSKCFDLFNPASLKLHEAVRDIHPLYHSMLHYLLKWKEHQSAMYMQGTMEAPPMEFEYILLGLLVLLCAGVACHSRLPLWLRVGPKRRVVSIRSLSSTFTALTLAGHR